MQYREHIKYRAARYRNTTQAMTPRVVVTPSIDTARTHLANLRVNLSLGINTDIYAAKIQQIYAAHPELAKGDASCQPQ